MTPVFYSQTMAAERRISLFDKPGSLWQQVAMTNLSLKQTFNGSYPHLAWTKEEEEAFNRIPATEYVPPTLMGRFKNASKAAIDKIVRAFESTPYTFHP